MQVIALINTTAIPVGMTAAEARAKRKAGEPENNWRTVIEKGKSYDRPDDEAKAWIKMGVARAADGSAEPDPQIAAAMAAANDGQGAANPDLNLDNPELAADGQNAVAARIKRLNELAQQPASAN